MTRIATDGSTPGGRTARGIWVLAAVTAALTLAYARAPAASTPAGTYQLTWPAPKCPPGECDQSAVHATLVLLDREAPDRGTLDERNDVCFGQGLALTGCYISPRGEVHRVNWRNGDRYRPSEVGLSCGADYQDRLFILAGDELRATWRGNVVNGSEGAAMRIKRIGAADPQRCQGPAGESLTTLGRPLRQRGVSSPALLRHPGD